jgi:hypothetical protein
MAASQLMLLIQLGIVTGVVRANKISVGTLLVKAAADNLLNFALV